MESVDRKHPSIIAFMRGPVVLTLDFNYHDPAFQVPKREEDLPKWMISDAEARVFSVRRPDGRPVRLKFRPFFDQAEHFPYRMYFDLNAQPYAIW